MIQELIWDAGGFLFTVLLILSVCVTLLSYIINRLSWWFDKKARRNLFYWIKNKKRINEIIENENKRL